MIKKTKLQLITIAMSVIILLGLNGCGKKPEAIITVDGEETSESSQEYETLAASTARKFSYNDLTVGGVQYLMTEEQVKKLLGEPVTVYDSKEKKEYKDNKETKESKENAETQQSTAAAGPEISERVYSYNELTLIFSEIKGQYVLTAAASVGDNEVFARGLKVGDTVDDILSVYYRDMNCMNNTYYSEDHTAKIGMFLYGDFSMEALDKVKISEAIEYGVINFNGYLSLEAADSYIVEMTYFEPPYKTGTATVQDDFAQIAFDIDKDGKITAIRWYYYPEEE